MLESRSKSPSIAEETKVDQKPMFINQKTQIFLSSRFLRSSTYQLSQNVFFMFFRHHIAYCVAVYQSWVDVGFLGRCRFRFYFSILFYIDVGFGFSNYRDIGVDFDFLTNIAFQGKSFRPMFVCHIREVCKQLTAIATAVVNSLF